MQIEPEERTGLVEGRRRSSRRCSQRRSELDLRFVHSESAGTERPEAGHGIPQQRRLVRDQNLQIERLPIVDLGPGPAVQKSSPLQAPRFPNGICRNLRRL